MADELDTQEQEQETAAPAVAEPATPAGPDPGWYDQVNRFIETAQPTLEQLASALQAPEPQQPEGELTLEQFIQKELDQRMNDQLGEYKPLLGMIAERESERATREHLDTISKEIGKFDQDQAVLHARALVGQGVPVEQALKLAAKKQLDYEAELKRLAQEEFKASLQNREGALSLPASDSGIGREVQAVPTGDGEGKYLSVVDNWVRDQQALRSS